MQRFLIPFLPLFAACLWLEGKQVAGRLMAALRGPRPVVEKVFASTFAALMVALILGMTWNSVGGDRAQTRKLSQDRAALLVEKREAYEWLRHNSPDDARVIATEDVCVYLYAGRQAIEHIEFSPAGLYDPALFTKDLDHMTDVAKAIGAAYWLASSDDTERQWIATRPLLAARLDQIESVLPELFRSQGGRVRIYGLGCVQHPEGPSCRSANPTLFPSESRSANR